MMTLKQFHAGIASVPAAVSWYLADLGESRGKQELFTAQSPQVLRVLREHALIESAVSSNRIEGLEIEQARVGTVVFGSPLLRDRSEEAIRGYRDALQLIHEQRSQLDFSEELLRKFHRLCSGEIWDAGQYKEKDGDIIEKYPDGRQRVRFKPVSATDTPEFMSQLIRLWRDCVRERTVHPLVALAGFNLDFLCIHPFRDGNGRVSRLVLLLQLYQAGYEVGRYISLERLIEQNKERYYETLEQSSQGWHHCQHDPWPYINYLLFILKTAYREFEERVGGTPSPKGAKAEDVLRAIRRQTGEFRMSEIERACPGVGREWIRRILADLKKQGEAKVTGRGPAARWRYLAKSRKGTTTK
ncbi:MAG TPA: Fic family protein [Candidatus Angelobacter sp.]|jgi:Fic family protein|nr:Fic family protein [Candidatus Angelobacter sp.]